MAAKIEKKALTPGFLLMLTLILLTSVMSTVAQESVNNSVDPKNSPDFQLISGEHMDIRQGGGYWDINLLNIPGSAGLDINVNISYKKLYKPTSVTDHYSVGNWQLEVPRIRHAGWGGHLGSAGCSKPISIVRITTPTPTSRCESVFNFVTRQWETKCTPTTIYNTASYVAASGVTWLSPGQAPRFFHGNKGKIVSSQYKYVSQDNWVGYCAANEKDFIVKSTDGLTYTLDVRAWDEGDSLQALASTPYIPDDADIAHYASKVEDAHGNWIKYDYELYEAITKNYHGYTKNNQQALLKKISASDGREVSFSYYSGERKKLKTVNSSGRTWTLTYDGDRLKNIKLPDNSTYVIGHPSRGFSVKFPKGAKVTYKYASERQSGRLFGDSGFGGGILPRPIISREISGPSIAGSKTIYTYSKPNSGINKTEATTGNEVEKYYYNRNNNKQGHLFKYEIYESGKKKRTEEYVWRNGKDYGGTWLGIIYKNDEVKKSYQLQKTLGSLTVDSKYKTIYSDFDGYGNPKTITQTGDGNRSTTRTFFNKDSSDGFFIGVVEDETFSGGEKINRTFNSEGSLTYLDTFGIKEEFIYHSSGDLHKKINFRDTLSRKVTTEYLNYDRGIAQKTIFPDKSVVEKDVNAFGETLWEKNQLGKVTNYKYDNIGRVRLIDLPSHSDTSIVWRNPNLKIETRSNFLTETSYDGFGREILVKRFDNKIPQRSIYSNTKYDGFGRVIFKSYESESSNPTQGVSYGYDVLNRKTWVKKSDSSIDRYYYDDDWNNYGSGYPKVTNGYGVVDSEGYFQIYDYKAYGDPGNRELYKILEQIKKPDTAQGLDSTHYVTTRLNYTKLGDIKSVIQGGYTRNFEYDANRPRLISKLTQPEIGDIKFTYDYVGNQISKSIGKNTTRFIFNDLNRLTKIDYPGSTRDVGFDYYATGDIHWKDNGLTRLIHTYNNNRQLTSEELNIDGYSKSISYSYNDLGNMSSINYPSSNTVKLNPDVFGRPTTLGKFSGSIDHHPNGALAKVKLANGVTTTFSLDNRHFIEKIDSSGLHGAPIRYHYTYDSLGNVETIMDYNLASNDRSMSYDGLGRLSTAYSKYWGGLNEYHYDQYGNLKEKITPVSTEDFGYDRNNLLSFTSSGKSFRYDEYGNTTYNGTFNFTYDHASRLIEAAGKTFSYGASGNKVKTSVRNKNSYHFYNKAGQLIYEWDTDKSSDFVYLGSSLFAKEEYCRKLDADSDGIPDCVETSWGLDLNDPADALQDRDGDGLSNLREYNLQTSLTLKDTDGDLINDYYEVRYGLNPIDGSDAGLDMDGDGLSNYQEYLINTNPFNKDTDGDGIPDNEDEKPNFNVAVLIVIISGMLL